MWTGWLLRAMTHRKTIQVSRWDCFIVGTILSLELGQSRFLLTLSCGLFGWIAQLSSGSWAFLASVCLY